jgi:hypothetical protein
MTYQSQPMDDLCYRYVNTDVKQKKVSPIHSLSQPVGQCRAIHGWGEALTKKNTGLWAGPALLINAIPSSQTHTSAQGAWIGRKGGAVGSSG